MEKRLSSWSCEDVSNWLKEKGFGDYSEELCTKHKIDGQALLTLTEDDLKQPPIKLVVLGDIKRLMSTINCLRVQDPDFNASLINSNVDVMQARSSSHRLSPKPSDVQHIERLQFNGAITESSPESFSSCQPNFSEIRSLSQEMESKTLDPEPWKTLLSFIYVFAVFLLTAFVMVIVHDRVPDMQKYPPLPDLFLDNMPYVPWAFDACELVGVILCAIWTCLLIFHKHRFILLRRMFSLMGTIFLLRCVTMLITSMSVPGRHLNCVGKHYGNWWMRLEQAIQIWRGMGMSLQGVRSCGDYMFSGHTSIITMLNFFITEYTPKTEMYYLHVTCWVLNMFGIFFILAAHEHYSIDVFIAFYLTSRMFLYYHTLANNRSLMQQDAYRTRIYFPLFSFFESRCQGMVPNEYEWPFRIPTCLRKLTSSYQDKHKNE